MSLCSLGDIVPDFVVDKLDLPLLIFDRVSFSILFWTLDLVLVKPFYRVDVGKSEERPRGSFEFGVELFNEGCRSRVGQQKIDGFADLYDRLRINRAMILSWITHDVFDIFHKIFEGDER